MCIKKNNTNAIITASIFTVIFFSDFQIFPIKFEADLILFIVGIYFTFKTINYWKTKGLTRLEIYFCILIFYFFVQSIRGAIFTHNFLSIRWPFFFLIIVLFSLYVFKNNKSFRISEISTSIEYSTIFSILVFIFFSILNSFFDGKILIGKTYLFFPLIYVIYFNFFQIKINNKLRSNFLLLLALISVIFSSSRGAFLPTLIIAIVVFYKKGLIQKLKYISTMTISFLIILALGYGDEILALLGDSLSIFTDFLTKDEVAEIHDLDRLIHLVTSIESVTKDSYHFIFGYGFRTEGIVFSNSLADYYKVLLPNLDYIQELNNPNNVDSFGIPAFISNYGLLGCLMFLTYIIMLYQSLILYDEFWYNFIILLILFFSLMRLYGNNFLNDYFFYFLIMPNGFMFFLKEYVLKNSYDEFYKKSNLKI